MPLGPVFNVELLTTSRRARFYALRFAYGLMVLFQIFVVYNSWSWRLVRGQDLTINEMAQFAVSIFTSFAFLQAAVVLLLTPALVGGTIADERQRKTLHYLLTSQLGGGEIVLGKLAARLLQLGVFLAMGLPVVSLIGLFGGVDPMLIALTYAGTVTSMYFLATMSILVSVHSRTPRESIAALYLIGILWLMLPPLLLGLLPSLRPTWWAVIGPWLGPVLEWVAVSSPMYVIPGVPWGGGLSLAESALWVMGMQVVYGSIMAAIAAWRLRPAFRKIEGGGQGSKVHWLRAVTAKRSWLPRPPCGDDAMLWKERYVSRTAGLSKVMTVILGSILFGLMCWAGYYVIEPVVTEIRLYGWSDVGSSNRKTLHDFLVGVSITIYVIWGLGVASAAASGVSSEREGDTWLSLTATPLSGREILRAKMIGAAWSLRILVYLLLALWALGMVLGAIHPLGVMLGAIEFAVFTWFVAALGTAISLRSKNSTRALAGTMLVLMIANGGYLFCCIPLRPDTPLMLVGCTPSTFGFSLFSYQTAGHLLSGSPSQAFGWRRGAEMVATGFVCVVGYAFAAFAITGHAFSMFDVVAGRPDRFNRPVARPAPEPRPVSSGGLE